MASFQPDQLNTQVNLQNVNALVPGQTLPFGRALTVIFGANGSGKSGYARVLGCAGFTRGDQEVLPDIMQPSTANQPRSAEIQLEVGETSKAIHYEIGEGCPELSPFYVFDSTSVTIHLTKSNKISFCPAGLAHLTRLGKVLDECTERLRVITGPLLQPHSFGPLFYGESRVNALIRDLGPKIDIKGIKKLAALTSQEQQNIKDLDVQIARLKSQEVSTQMAEINQTINDLSHLIKRLRDVERAVGNSAINENKKAIEAVVQQQAVSERAGLDQFKSPDFAGVGSPAWKRLIEAARALASVEGRGDGQYPCERDRCLLCRQHLSAEASDLLQRLWEFMGNESQARLDMMRSDLEQKRKALAAADLNCFNDQHVSHRHLQQHDKSLLEKVAGFIESARMRRDAGLLSIKNLSMATMPSLPEAGIPEIEQVIGRLENEQNELDLKNPENEILELEKQLLELKHREILGQHLPEILDYVEKRKWADKANKAIGNTRHITQKYMEMFNRLVTENYVEFFGRVLRELNCTLNVKLKTKGQKGETHKQIFLETDSSSNEGVTKPDKILSEGEKRAVALADFLTEASIDENSCGIILDDPVTSLDWEWKETVAARLVVEAHRRQVIVFTHDSHFLYLMKKYSSQEGVDISSHWIKRDGESDKPGYIYRDNSPVTERDFRSPTKALEFWRRAKATTAPEEQEYLLQQGFGHLRTSYEALVVHEVFGEVVIRFEERISIDRLKNVVADKEILNEITTKVGLLSRYIGGHLHSDAFQAQRPGPEVLKQEIDGYEDLKKKIKKIRAETKKQNQTSLS